MGRVNRTSEPFIRHNRNLKRSIKRVEARLNAELSRIAAGCNEGAEAVANAIFERSQHYVPVDTRALKDSAKISVTHVRRGGADVTGKIVGQDKIFTISYNNNGDAPYAVFVHERLDQRHDPPTQAKFLEQAIKDVSGNALRIIASKVR